jgi:hypothetical protein
MAVLVVVLVVIQVPHKMAERQLLVKALTAAKETQRHRVVVVAVAVLLLLV